MSMISQTTGYALRALAFLSQSEDGERVLTSTIAEATEIPEAFLGKIMRDLARAGLVESVRGRGGGYFLLPANRSRPIADVMQLFERMDRFESCIMGESHCPGIRACGMHNWWNRISAEFLECIKKTTIADMVHDGDWVGEMPSPDARRLPDNL